MIDIIEGHGHHWSLWTYKDIGMMGTILVNPESEWMDRTKPIRKVKSSLRCDSWIERIPKSIDPLINQVAEYSAEVIPFVIKKDLQGNCSKLSRMECSLRHCYPPL